MVPLLPCRRCACHTRAKQDWHYPKVRMTGQDFRATQLGLNPRFSVAIAGHLAYFEWTELGDRLMKQDVSERIPDALAPRVEAARRWFNDSADAAGDTFKVTGILDADAALEGSDELKLILCGGDRCEQRSFRVSGEGPSFLVEQADPMPVASGKPQAELDPPPGARLGWLDNVMAQHAFVVLLFYRGFW